MNNVKKRAVLCTTTALAILLVFLHASVPQPLSFHNFADKRAFLGIPNFANVISNIPFLIFGIYGLLSIQKARRPRASYPSTPPCSSTSS